MEAPSASTVRTVHEAAGAGGSFDEVVSRRGAFWTSRRRVDRVVEYRAQVPGGLHVGAGIASMDFDLEGLGRFALRGPALTLLSAPAGGLASTTRLARGDSRSCGLFSPFGETGESVDPMLAAVLDEALRRRRVVVAPLSAVQALWLCSPLPEELAGPARRIALEARELELLSVAIHACSGYRPELQAPGPSRQLAQRVRELLDSQPRRVHSLAALAIACDASPARLARAFRAEYGISLARHLAELRLAHALADLEAGLPIARVAERAGYSRAHFTQAFRRRFGVSPSDVLCSGTSAAFATEIDKPGSRTEQRRR